MVFGNDRTAYKVLSLAAFVALGVYMPDLSAFTGDGRKLSIMDPVSFP